MSYYRSIPKSLERSTAHKIMWAMLNGDERFVEPTPQSLQNLTLHSVKEAVMNQFVSDNMEVCGHFADSSYAMNFSLIICANLLIVKTFNLNAILFFICFFFTLKWKLFFR